MCEEKECFQSWNISDEKIIIQQSIVQMLKFFSPDPQIKIPAYKRIYLTMKYIHSQPGCNVEIDLLNLSLEDKGLKKSDKTQREIQTRKFHY